MQNPWQKAYEQAARSQERAVADLVGQQVGRVPDEVQRARYGHFKQNPGELIRWSAQVNGQERALEEAKRYMKAMEERYGSV